MRIKGKKELPASLLYETFSEVKAIQLNCQLLITGVIKKQPMIFQIEKDFSVTPHHIFGVIGSGGIIAESALFQMKLNSHGKVSQTVYHVYESKKLSQIAEGVGEGTDLVVLSPDLGDAKEVKARFINSESYPELDKMYKEHGFKNLTLDWDYKTHLSEL
jgi:hypothetical protein